MGFLQELINQVGLKAQFTEILLSGVLIVMRIIPLVFQTPFLGGKLVPPETRMGISVMLTVLAYPFAVGQLDKPLELNAVVFLVLIFKELFIGFVIGFIAAELFYAMEIAGRGLDTLRGSNMAEVQVPELAFRVAPVGQFAFQLLLVVFCALGGHGFFIEGVMETFRLVPIDSFPGMHGGWHHVVDQIMRYTNSLFGIAFALVFPGMFASFLVDVVFGMFNRIAPQLNAYFMAMGIKAMAGLALFMFAMTLMVGELARRLEDSLLFLRRLMALMS